MQIKERNMDIPRQTREMASFLSLLQEVYPILTVDDKDQILNIIQEAITRNAQKEKERRQP